MLTEYLSIHSATFVCKELSAQSLPLATIATALAVYCNLFKVKEVHRYHVLRADKR